MRSILASNTDIVCIILSSVVGIQNQIAQDTTLTVRVTEVPDPGVWAKIGNAAPLLIALASAAGAAAAYYRAKSAERSAKQKVRFAEVLGDLRAIEDAADSCNQAALRFIMQSAKTTEKDQQGNFKEVEPGSAVEVAISQLQEALFEAWQRLQEKRRNSNAILPQDLKQPIDTYLEEVGPLARQSSIYVEEPEEKAERLESKLSEIQRASKRYIQNEIE